MRLRWKIITVLVVIAIISSMVVSSRPNHAQRELEQTRRSLQQQGFKIDLAEFNLSISPELSNRAAMLARTTLAALTNRADQWPMIMGELRGLLAPAGKDAALVVWKLEKLKGYNTPNLWPELRDAFSTNQARLGAARRAAISGPIRFEPIGRGLSALLPYLADVKALATTFGAQTVL